MSSETTLAVTSFSQQFSSTPRGARLARLATVRQLVAWGWPYTGEPCRTAALLVCELAANAVRHGRLPGRDFLLRLGVAAPPGGRAVLRIEVEDEPEGIEPPSIPGIELPSMPGIDGIELGAEDGDDDVGVVVERPTTDAGA